MVAVRLPRTISPFDSDTHPSQISTSLAQNLQTQIQTPPISLHISSPISLHLPPPDARSNPRLHAAPSSSSPVPRDIYPLQHQRRLLRLANFPARWGFHSRAGLWDKSHLTKQIEKNRHSRMIHIVAALQILMAVQ